MHLCFPYEEFSKGITLFSELSALQIMIQGNIMLSFTLKSHTSIKKKIEDDKKRREE
jgi:hypothetical protein